MAEFRGLIPDGRRVALSMLPGHGSAGAVKSVAGGFWPWSHLYEVWAPSILPARPHIHAQTLCETDDGELLAPCIQSPGTGHGE